MDQNRRWDLQLLAGEEAPDAPSGGEAAEPDTGVNAGDAGLQERLEALGVPPERIRRRQAALARQAARNAAAGASAADAPPAAAEGGEEMGPGDEAKPAPDDGAEEQFAPTREKLLADPAVRRVMDEYANEIVRMRVRKNGRDAAAYRTLRPVIGALAASCGLDADEPDPQELLDRLGDRLREDREDGTAPERRSRREETMRSHLDALRREESLLRRTRPDFDLGAELRDPAFARLVAPGSPVSLEDAYYALHRRELEREQHEAAERAALENASRSILAGRARPIENGAASLRAAQPRPDPHDKSYREALKKEIYAAAARGEHLPLRGER